MNVAPSILSANFNNLLDEINSVKVNDNIWIHCDVMDGHFVPNITFGACVIKNIKSKCNLLMDVHLMIDDPYKYSIDFVKAGADIVTFHYEAVKEEDITKVIDLIKSNNCKVGISIKPKTDPKVLDKWLDKIDLVLVMSVEPGFGGQKFMENSLDKLRYYKEQKIKRGYKYVIEVDGGINYETAKLVKNAGCEVVVAGSFVFKADNRKEVVNNLLNI